MNKIKFLIASAFAILLFASCSKKYIEISIKPISTEIDWEIKNYLQIQDRSYKIQKEDGKTMGGGYNYTILIGIENISSEMHEFENYRSMTLTIFDKQGVPLSGIREFELDYGSDSKLEDLLQKKVANDFITFKGYAEKGSPINKNGFDTTQIGGFKIVYKANIKQQSNNSTQYNNQSSSTYSSDDEKVVTKKSGNTNWDKVLTDYEAYTDKYIKLLKKANAGDASVMTEYMEMLEKAQSFQESLENADDDLTPAQLQKFTKIQMKLVNAASGL